MMQKLTLLVPLYVPAGFHQPVIIIGTIVNRDYDLQAAKAFRQ
jgi:hypothetical protein